MNRKKIILIAASALTAATVAVGGTLAYFTSTKNAANTFTVGNVTISLNESKVQRVSGSNLYTKVLDEKENVVTTSSNSYTAIYPGAELPKDPTVTVAQNSEDCYVRMIVTIPNYATLTDNAKTFFNNYFTTINTNGWTYDSVETLKKNVGGTYYLKYTDATNGYVKKNTAAATTLDPAFETIVIPKEFVEADMNSLVIGGDFKINVQAEAIQAQGFTNAATAYAALD